jgi:hypothetical protein
MQTAQALGRARLAARARRVARIRRMVLVATLAAFVLAWGVIAFDGPMGRATAASSGTASTTSSSGDSFSQDGFSAPGDDGSSAVPLTTSQS